MTTTDDGDDISDMTLLDGTPLTDETIAQLVAEAEAGGEPAPPEEHHLTPVAKIGRPPLGATTRDKLLTMRATAEEIKDLDNRAAQASMSRTDYMRSKLGLPT